MSKTVPTQTITTAAAQLGLHHAGGPAVLSLSGTFGGTTATFQVNLDPAGGADHWVPLEDLDGVISITEAKAFSTEELPECQIRCTTTNGTGIDLLFVVRVGKY